ncbi:DUF5961 family protein [Phenylobacterium sp.]
MTGKSCPETGHEHCFRISLESGETSACG